MSIEILMSQSPDGISISSVNEPDPSFDDIKIQVYPKSLGRKRDYLMLHDTHYDDIMIDFNGTREKQGLIGACGKRKVIQCQRRMWIETISTCKERRQKDYYIAEWRFILRWKATNGKTKRENC